MKRKHRHAFDALNHLLHADFETATKKQMVTAEAAADASSGALPLILAIKHWAFALADVCRLHVGKCVEINADCGEQNPTKAALEMVALALCKYLWLPTSRTSTLFSNDDWPEQNAVREFVFQVSGTPVDLIDSELVTKTVLPRSEPKSRLARMIAGLSPTPPEGKDAPFLTVDETQKVVHGLEESFRNALFDGLQNAYSAALLANYRVSRPESSASIPPKHSDMSQYFEPARLTPRQKDILSLRLEHGMNPHQIAKHLGLHHSTIQEHLRAGTARIQQAMERGKKKRQAARQGVKD
jgi:predicted DNA-binding protein (UPF0251 family)